MFQPSIIGNWYLDGGDHDWVSEWSEGAVEVKDPNMPYIGIPTFDPIRSHPRYPALIRSFNFPEEFQERYLAHLQ